MCSSYSVNKNFHTHTYRCNHACGSAMDYYKTASSLNFKALGFSDHVPFPYKTEKNKSMFIWRMRYDEKDSYLSEIQSLKKTVKDMKIYTGFECEYFKEYDSYYQELTNSTDYLILGAHFFINKKGSFQSSYEVTNTKQGLIDYTDNILEGLSSKYFKLLAHPDLFGILYPKWDSTCDDISDTIIKTCIEYDVPLEINGFGFIKGMINTPEGPRYRYPWNPFWERVSSFSKAKVCINSDSHYPWLINGGFDKACLLAQKYNLNLIDLF